MLIFLENYSVLKISGVDSKSFLNSQFSNNILLLDSNQNQCQMNAYCQHQGKVISIISVLKIDDYFLLIFPKNLLEKVSSKLNLYKMMSLVNIENLSERMFLYGQINETDKKSYKIINNLSYKISPVKINSKLAALEIWEYECIKNRLPEIQSETSEKHIPQALNLDIDQIGVSFTKGCYPGQEVVARMHYLGKPKRRLFRFTSQFEVCIGDNLSVENSNSLKSSGQVIRIAKKGTEFHFLGVFEINHINENIFVNNDQNKLVNIVHE